MEETENFNDLFYHGERYSDFYSSLLNRMKQVRREDYVWYAGILNPHHAIVSSYEHHLSHQPRSLKMNEQRHLLDMHGHPELKALHYLFTKDFCFVFNVFWYLG